MGIREDFKLYTAYDGSISGELNPGKPSGNSIMYSAEKLIAYKQNEVCTGDDLREFDLILRQRALSSGLYGRTPLGDPYALDQEQPDDYYGLVAVAPLTALSVFEQGKRRKFRWAPFGRWNWFFFTIPLPYYFATAGQDDHDLNAWFGRYWGFVAHLRICAGARIYPWHSLVWAYSVACGPKGEDQDSWIIPWIMVWANKNPGWLERLAVKIYRERLKTAWGEKGIRAVFASYFKNVNHPLAVWTL